MTTYAEAEALEAGLVDLEDRLLLADATHLPVPPVHVDPQVRVHEPVAGGHALGLHGRSRRLGSGAERARSAVTWRIRSAIKKIAMTHPRLGRHLENSLKTGTFCVYQPETVIDWVC